VKKYYKISVEIVFELNLVSKLSSEFPVFANSMLISVTISYYSSYGTTFSKYAHVFVLSKKKTQYIIILFLDGTCPQSHTYKMWSPLRFA
jgi:hypothetical protein